MIMQNHANESSISEFAQQKMHACGVSVRTKRAFAHALWQKFLAEFFVTKFEYVRFTWCVHIIIFILGSMDGPTDGPRILTFQSSQRIPTIPSDRAEPHGLPLQWPRALGEVSRNFHTWYVMSTFHTFPYVKLLPYVILRMPIEYVSHVWQRIDAHYVLPCTCAQFKMFKFPAAIECACGFGKVLQGTSSILPTNNSTKSWSWLRCRATNHGFRQRACFCTYAYPLRNTERAISLLIVLFSAALSVGRRALARALLKECARARSARARTLVIIPLVLAMARIF